MWQEYKTSEEGYTLLELLVVMAIISLIVMAAPAAYRSIFPSFQVRQYANDIANLARELRREAVRHNRVTGLRYDPDGGTVAGFGWNDPLRIRYIHVPSNVSISFGRQMQWVGSSGNSVEFYPAGGSSGGTLDVTRGGVNARVQVDWVSGSVEVQQ